MFITIHTLYILNKEEESRLGDNSVTKSLPPKHEDLSLVPSLRTRVNPNTHLESRCGSLEKGWCLELTAEPLWLDWQVPGLVRDPIAKISQGEIEGASWSFFRCLLRHGKHLDSEGVTGIFDSRDTKMIGRDDCGVACYYFYDLLMSEECMPEKSCYGFVLFYSSIMDFCWNMLIS